MIVADLTLNAVFRSITLHILAVGTNWASDGLVGTERAVMTMGALFTAILLDAFRSDIASSSVAEVAGRAVKTLVRLGAGRV